MRILVRAVIFVVALIVCIPLLTPTPVYTADPQPQGPETILATWDRPEAVQDAAGQFHANYHFLRTDPRSTRITYTESDNDRMRMVINGQPEKWYDQILGGATFTPAGQPRYIARKGTQYVVVTDEQESADYDRIKALFPWEIPEQTLSVLDEQWEEDKYSFRSDTHPIAFFTLPGTDQYGYVARTGLSDVLVLNDQVYATYPEIRRIAMSTDGKQLVLSVSDGKYRRIVKDGILQPEQYDLSALNRGEGIFEFSRDGRHFAYQAKVAGKSLLVIDGKVREDNDQELPVLFASFPYRDLVNNLRDANPSLSTAAEQFPLQYTFFRKSDKQPLAELIRDGQQQRLRVNGLLSAPYDKISPYFSTELATGLACVASRNGKSVVLVNGIEQGQWFDAIFELMTNTTGTHLFYNARNGKQQYTVVDNIVMPPVKSWPTYSPDGQHMAYVNGSEWNMSVVIDDTTTAYPDYNIGNINFSPHGDTYFTALHRSEDRRLGWKSCVFVNGQPGPEYDSIHGSVVFDSPTHYHYIARRDRQFLRVDADIR